MDNKLVGLIINISGKIYDSDLIHIGDYCSWFKDSIGHCVRTILFVVHPYQKLFVNSPRETTPHYCTKLTEAASTPKKLSAVTLERVYCGPQTARPAVTGDSCGPTTTYYWSTPIYPVRGQKNKPFSP